MSTQQLYSHKERMFYRNKARAMQASLGTRVAAGYLRNRGISLEMALSWLVL